MMEPVVIGVGAAFLMGLAFGSGPCAISCLPYLGPVFVSPGHSRKRTLLPFSLGRFVGYLLLAMTAGMIGASLTSLFDSPWSHRLLGVVTIVLGMMLWRRGRERSSSVCASTHRNEVSVPLRQPSLFLMGLSMTLNPCMPLSTVLVAAAATSSALSGAMLGAAFGIGAVLVPTLLFATLIHYLGQQTLNHLSSHRHRLERSAAALLIGLGFFTLIGWVTP